MILQIDTFKMDGENLVRLNYKNRSSVARNIKLAVEVMINGMEDELFHLDYRDDRIEYYDQEADKIQVIGFLEESIKQLKNISRFL